jgi:endonuclease/exonuclease/phosphatase family metal-dependent hydrolase
MRLCTFNIHEWEDADGSHSLGRVVDLLTALECDVIALQESLSVRDGRPHDLASVATELDMRVVEAPAAHGLSNALLVRDWPSSSGAVDLWVPGSEARSAAWAALASPWGSLAVFSVHLDHLREVTRVRQLQLLFDVVAASGSEAIILGDFNAIDLADYPEIQRVRIQMQRSMAGLEPARGAEVSAIRGRGWVDLVRLASSDGVTGYARSLKDPVPKSLRQTSAYGTRVDYAWATPLLASRSGVSARVISTDASDHGVVVVDVTPNFAARE